MKSNLLDPIDDYSTDAKYRVLERLRWPNGWHAIVVVTLASPRLWSVASMREWHSP